MYAIRFEAKTEKIIATWKKSNPILFKRRRNVLLDMMEHPRTGIGHPEPLVGGGDVIYSRRISANNRIIYRIDDNEVIVVMIELSGHYNNK